METEPQAQPIKIRITTEQEQSLAGLFKARNKNAVAIGEQIIRLIKAQDNGMNQQNTNFVVAYLTKKFLVGSETLRDYIWIGRKLKLPEVFNARHMRIGELAWPLPLEDQRKLVFDGVLVVEHLDQDPVRKRLHEITDDREANRVIHNHRISTPAEQRGLFNLIPPPKSDKRLFSLSKNGKVRFHRSVSVDDLLDYFCVQLRKVKRKVRLKCESSPMDRKQFDTELKSELQRISPTARG